MIDETIQDAIKYFKDMGPWTSETTTADVMPKLLTFCNKAIPALNHAQKKLIDQEFELHDLRKIRDGKIEVGAGALNAQRSIIEKLEKEHAALRKALHTLLTVRTEVTIARAETTLARTEPSYTTWKEGDMA